MARDDSWDNEAETPHHNPNGRSAARRAPAQEMALLFSLARFPAMNCPCCRTLFLKDIFLSCLFWCLLGEGAFGVIVCK